MSLALNRRKFWNDLGGANVTGPFGTGKSAGVVVLLSPHFSGSVQRFLFDSDGRILNLLFTFGPLSKLNVINIYAPNLVSDRKTFF